MGPVSARFSLSERQTLARSTFLSRIATRFRHNACDTQPLLSEPPFVIPSGCAVPFFRTRPFARERLSRFAGGVGSRRFSFASFFPSFPSLFCPDGPDAADTDASRTPFTRPSFDGPSADAVPRSVRWHTIFCRFHATRGRFAYPASMFFPGSRRNVLHSCRWAVGSFQIRECRCSPVFPAFSATVFCRSRPIVFRCKVRVPTGTTCQILTNGVAAQIFLYRACGLGLRPKIKRIYALSLVHPSAAPTF